MSNGILIDTNLLLVMIIGRIDDGRYIVKSKRLGNFCVEDYHQLWKFVEGYSDAIITPYIAAEVSNLIDLQDPARTEAFQIARAIFKQFIQPETLISDDCHDSFFLKFGLADNSIIKLSKKFDIITSDFRIIEPLYNFNPNGCIFPYTPYKQRT